MEKYVSVFANKKSKSTIKDSLNSLKTIQKSLKNLKEDDEVKTAKALDAAIDQVEDIIADIIDVAGATHPAVSDLIDTVSDLEISQSTADIQDEFEFSEAEECDDEEDLDAMEEELLNEECPSPEQNGPSGYCKRQDGAKMLGKCQDGFVWDSKTNKCVKSTK